MGEAKGNQTLGLHWGGKLWKVAKVPSPGSGDFLNGVTATSGSDAWAVGYTGSGLTLVIHWNGKSWQQVTSPSPSSGGFLYDVAVASAHTAWAVGYTGAVTSLILRWKRGLVEGQLVGRSAARFVAFPQVVVWVMIGT